MSYQGDANGGFSPCTALNIQIQLEGITNCRVYVEQDADIKTNEITSRLSQSLVDLCTCTFNFSLLVNPFIVCFDDSPQHVTYRAMLTGTNTLSARELSVLIEQWIESDLLVVVQSAGLGVIDTCPVVIAALNSPECPEDLTNRTLSTPLPSTTIATSTAAPSVAVSVVGAVAGGVVAGVLAIAVIVLLIVVIIVVVLFLRARRSGSKDISDGKTNSQQTE